MDQKIYTLKISMMYFPQLYRIIEITGTSTVAKIAYTVLASFNTAMYHLYDIEYKDKRFSCGIGDDYAEDHSKPATNFKIHDLKLKVKDHLSMTYDFGCDQEFDIEVLKIESKRDIIKAHYPKIIEGLGKGIIEDMHVSELEEIVQNNKTVDCLNMDGYKKYKFEDYDVKKDNKLLHERLYRAITSYEELG